jgi:hypothetical protein
MLYRIGSALVGLALAVSMSAMALAQADEGSSAAADAVPADTAVTAPAADATIGPTLFLQLTDPAEQDVEVPLAVTHLTVRGITLAGAVVSVDGDLVDTDDQGGFIDLIALDAGASEIEVVTSDGQGNQVTMTVFVVRGE